jgi:MFS transporter, SP family, solute carrier family 2 (myo-inositol transporter), member 13
MVVLNVVMITGGQVVAYGIGEHEASHYQNTLPNIFIGAAFENLSSGGWRWMVGLGAVPAGLQFFVLFFLPESRKFSSISLA